MHFYVLGIAVKIRSESFAGDASYPLQKEQNVVLRGKRKTLKNLREPVCPNTEPETPLRAIA